MGVVVRVRISPKSDVEPEQGAKEARCGQVSRCVVKRGGHTYKGQLGARRWNPNTVSRCGACAVAGDPNTGAVAAGRLNTPRLRFTINVQTTTGVRFLEAC